MRVVTNARGYECAWYGRELVKVDRWFPSTKRCSDCGHVGESKPLDVRQWTCKECGSVHDRDVNAASNLKQVGTAGLAGAQKFLREGSGGQRKTSPAIA